MSYTFPIEIPVPKGPFDLCDGPVIEGTTQAERYFTRWAAWVGSTGIRYGQWSPGLVMDDALGNADDLFGAVRPAKISIAFEQDALRVIAIQKDATTIAVRRRVSGIVTEYTFAGIQPLLFYNGLVVPTSSSTDVVCYYLKTAGTTLFARFQRDNFGVEYTVNASFNNPLSQLLKTDRFKISGSEYQIIFALDNSGNPVQLRSKAYPPFPEYVTDHPSADTTMAPGASPGLYFRVIVTSTVPGDAGKVDTTVLSGAYASVILTTTAPGDAGKLDTTVLSGLYFLVVVGSTTPGDAASEDTTILSGAYTKVVVNSTTPGDAGSVDTTLQSGSYS